MSNEPSPMSPTSPCPLKLHVCLPPLHLCRPIMSDCVCLYGSLQVYLYVYLYVYLSAYLSICLPFYMSVYKPLCVCLLACLLACVCVCVCLSACLPFVSSISSLKVTSMRQLLLQLGYRYHSQGH